MAATTMATAAGAVVLLYYVLSRRMSSAAEGEDSGGGDYSKSKSRSEKKRLSRRPAQAPATWLETISTLAETLRFTYSETLGKWPIGDLAFGINYLIRRQGNLQVASVYAGENSVRLKGPEIIDQLYYYLKLLTLCMLFSKKPFPVFLGSAGFSDANVLLQKPKAGILKPAFTILRDENSKCFLLLIRGTHSIKDTLTAATGAVVPFHHSVLHDGGISNLVLGYAHCGMVAAARWIAKLSTPSLLKALEQNPDYDVKIVGHSLGGGTAALLTYILREQHEFSATTCVSFAPAACMTWELAESGKNFITTIINGSDLVPTFSAASVDDLRSEVTASSWLNDLRDQVERNRVLNVIYRSATALGSRLPSISNARARVVGAGALLRPVSSSTQVVMRRAQDVAQAVVKTRTSISSWTCMGPRRRANAPSSNSKTDDLPDLPLITERTSESLVTEVISCNSDTNNADYCSSSDSGTTHDETDEDEDLVQVEKVVTTSTIEEITEGQLWYELEKELKRQGSEVDAQVQEEEDAVAKEITEEEKVFADAVESHTPISSSDVSDNHHFYPPGRIMHIISVPPTDSTDQSHDDLAEEQVGIYETPRELYSKLRLSRTMINDHYMPMYKKMMELLIKQLEDELDSGYVVDR
ncbi:Sn1-specific diacylglycerol lipase alpha [Sesamum alatum]|uniref:Sn1-specific diacylglycerol lipase alpha n=1 Tax=Sesamum alatum TaxID=300844 RepID=A0AAE1Y9Z2_9LAMI|nr:Sn1-specific diacylglycerol lipase alpha [Sesamum alatum]